MLMKNNRGATMVEYGIMVGLVSLASFVGIIALGPQVRATFQTSADNIDDATASSAPAPVVVGPEVAGPAPVQPGSCFLIAAAVGTVNAVDHPGISCFRFADDIGVFDQFSGLGGDDFSVVSGAAGPTYETGSGDDVGFFSMGTCVRSSPTFGGGMNQIVVQNQTSSDATFFTDGLGVSGIEFVDGSAILYGTGVSSFHFTDVSLTAAEVAAMQVAPPPSPVPGC